MWKQDGYTYIFGVSVYDSSFWFPWYIDDVYSMVNPFITTLDVSSACVRMDSYMLDVTGNLDADL